jgi:hypothetical protein
LTEVPYVLEQPGESKGKLLYNRGISVSNIHRRRFKSRSINGAEYEVDSELSVLLETSGLGSQE